MKFTPEVITALKTLRSAAENDFERHRIDVLERDLNAPPTAEVIDGTHQRFNGVTYRQAKDGHFAINTSVHRAVWSYYHGDIPVGYHIHHIYENKSNNAIDNLQLLTNSEHQQIHHLKPVEERTCIVCGKTFIPNEKRVKRSQTCCSLSCASKSRKKPAQKICPICGKTFDDNYKKNQLYCSRSCYMKGRWRSATSKSKTCPVCGKTFTSTSARAIYCSIDCYNEMRRQKRHEQSD